jgi:integrase
MKTFSRWLVRDGRAAANALAHLQAYNLTTDQRYVRRDLLPDELIRLIQAALRGPDVLGISGKDRAMAYCLAAGTGFRADELRSLNPDSFDLNVEPATVTVRAGHSKRRRNDVQEIRPDLAELLRPWLDTKAPANRFSPCTRKRPRCCVLI